MQQPANKLRQQKWFDNEEYPFKSHYMTINGHQMHYIDEGKGTPIVMVHGTPTWSFLYRNFVKQLSTQYRCIVPDHLGFGLSEKAPSMDCSAPQLAKNLEAFIQQLQLKEVILIIHDFGGPIGLHYAIKHASNVQKIVLMNTWCWATKDNPAAQQIDKILHSSLGRFLYLWLNFSPKFLLKKAFTNPKQLSKNIHQHYTKVFPRKNDRHGLLKIGQSLVGASDWYQQQWEQIPHIQDKPFLVLWGMQDTFIKPTYLERWKATLTNATIQNIDAGHFIQEEHFTSSISLIESFIEQE